MVLCDACNGYTRTKQFCVMAETHVFYATFAGRMERLKIIADDKIPFLKGVMEPYADIVYLPGAAITAFDVKDADALFTRTRTLCNEALLKGSRVRLIATATIGYDHIDTDYCDVAGIRWINAPGCNASSVQQYIAAACVMLAHERALRLADTTIGVIGVGNVGCRVAAAAEVLGMRVLLNDPPRAEREGDAAFVPLEHLLNESDIVTCHTPLTREGAYPTYHLASDDFFGRMKDGAVFINSSRGAVADSGALKRASRGKLSAFILDTWENEPAIDLDLLRDAFIGTPHIAGYSSDGKANGTAACVHEFCRFFGLDALRDWYPADIPPPPMSATLAIDGAGKTAEAIFYEAVTHTYPIAQDSERLKQSPAMFEKLRGDYWIRRECKHFSLHLTRVAEETRNGLAGLGFTLR